MKTVTKVQENAEDVMAEAKQINEERAAQEAACEQEDVCEEQEPFLRKTHRKRGCRISNSRRS